MSAISMTQQQKRIATVVTRVQEKTSSALQDQLKVHRSVDGKGRQRLQQV